MPGILSSVAPHGATTRERDHMTSFRRRSLRVTSLVICAVLGAATVSPSALADNKRLNDSVYANIYTAQQQNGCPIEARRDQRLDVAAQRHALDALNNPDVNGDIGSDGSTPTDRAAAAGFTGKIAQTMAINPALAISGIEILGQWYGDPVAWATMHDCSYTQIGVWSENKLDRSVVVAVYGAPA